MPQPDAKSVKAYITLETVVEKTDPSDLHEYLHKNRFRGQTNINYSQGGITNIVTYERIPITVEILEKLLAEMTDGRLK